MDISTNAAHYIDVPPGVPVQLELAGDFGGGTATFGYETTTGAFAALKLPGTTTSAAITANGLFGPVMVPKSGKVGISLAGSTAADLDLQVVPLGKPQQIR